MNRRMISLIDYTAARAIRAGERIAIEAITRESLDEIVAYLGRVHPRARWALGPLARKALVSRIDIEV